MNETRVPPGRCGDMEEVRHGSDRLDEEIVALIGERFRYMDAAARIKPDRESVRDEARKAEVLANVQRLAEGNGVPVQAAQDLYERLVESSIAYEFEWFDAIRG